MATLSKLTPCLWFDLEGEQAAKFYTSIFDNSRIVSVALYGPAGPDPERVLDHHRAEHENDGGKNRETDQSRFDEENPMQARSVSDSLTGNQVLIDVSHTDRLSLFKLT